MKVFRINPEFRIFCCHSGFFICILILMISIKKNHNIRWKHHLIINFRIFCWQSLSSLCFNQQIGRTRYYINDNILYKWPYIMTKYCIINEHILYKTAHKPCTSNKGKCNSSNEKRQLSFAVSAVLSAVCSIVPV